MLLLALHSVLKTLTHTHASTLMCVLIHPLACCALKQRVVSEHQTHASKSILTNSLLALVCDMNHTRILKRRNA